MKTVPNTLNLDLVDDAVNAIGAFAPEKITDAALLLLSWRRRGELSPADIGIVMSRLFPHREDRPAPTVPDCPSWCTGEHLSELDSLEFRDCESEETLVPTAENDVVGVYVEREFSRVTGVTAPAVVRIENHVLSPRTARHLARLLERAANLAEIA